jgi:outer membrane protein assembly factor BamE (lipoprotein component of BamABCDE complex)
MARKPRPGFRFPGPVPKEALEFFKAKELRPSFSYLDVSAEEHALQFTVAKSAGFDILGDVRDALKEHLREGGTLRTFEKQLTPILQEKGWWGRKDVTDPETGDPVSAQLGSPRRLRTIYRANMRSARAAGQWERIQRTKRTHPYLLYRLGPSENHRPEHVAWDGTLLPADDPWWADHMPPNGWGCKCWVRQVSEAEAQRLGGVTARPPRDEVEWTNPRTGIARRVDRGLDPSWASNPGRDRPRLLAEMLARGIDDLGELSEALAREEIARIAGSPLLERQLAGQGDTGDLPAGYLDREWREALGTPSTTAAFDDNTWYYFGETTQREAFYDPELIERHVLILRFDDGGLLSEVGTRDANSGREVTLVSRETPTAGHSFTVIEQILGNIGRFSDPAAPQ